MGFTLRSWAKKRPQPDVIISQCAGKLIDFAVLAVFFLEIDLDILEIALYILEIALCMLEIALTWPQTKRPTDVLRLTPDSRAPAKADPSARAGFEFDPGSHLGRGWAYLGLGWRHLGGFTKL